MKCIISLVSAYFKQTRDFIAVLLIGMTSISVGGEPPKLLPLPPIAPGLQLSRLFNDHMVLQRETPLKIWGWAASGEKLTVEFAEQRKSTTVAADGSWQVVLDPMPANATGRTLTVRSDTSNQQSAIHDVLVGEVWLLGGQSNMAFPFFVRNDGFDKAQIDANPQYQAIRCVSTLHGPWADPDWEKLDWVQKDPQKEIPYKREWVVFGPECLVLHGKAFSAFGFFFAKNLYDQLKVPIGLVDTSVGGTLAHYWASAESQKNIPELEPFFKEPVWTPGCLFNSTILPLKNMSFRGAAFYLGENNSLTKPISIFEPTYRAVITSWRQAFNKPEMPFLMIQTGAGGDVHNIYSPSDFNLVQEAQLRIHRTTPNTGFVVTADDLHTDLHVLRKQSHGQRASRWAMAEVYAKSVPPRTKLQTWGSPAFKSSETKGNKLILHFDVMPGDELKLTGTPAGFVVAGEDKQFVEAQAEWIDKTTVAVWSDEVGSPVAARFGWALRPYINLWTVSGLPVSPFRTDNWPNQ
jgi:sialate O-acetylesterase